MSQQLMSVGFLDKATYFFGGMLVFQGILGQVNPPAIAAQFGLSVPTPAHATYLPIWASRNMFFGLAFITFAYQGQRKASGVLFLLAGLIGGPSDIWYVIQDGAETSMVVAHAVMSGIIAALGRALYLS